jgi:cell division septum initiation protein DivIVA
MVTAAEDMNAALTLVDAAVKERDEARIRARDADQLRHRIDRLEYDLTMMRLSRDEARNQAVIAAIPMDEARAMARAEVRDILRPFLTEGGQSTRMLALTIKASLDAAWGKEVQ